MAKLTITLVDNDDPANNVALLVACEDYDNQSPAVNLGERLLTHLEQIATPEGEQPAIHVPQPAMRGPDMRKLAQEPARIIVSA